MGGILRVFLDDAPAPIWEGPAYEFLARRSRHFLAKAGLALDPGDAFVQTDADYFPVPFTRSLKVTWEGSLEELHFYHLQVRVYEAGAAVRTFDVVRDLQAAEPAIRETVRALTSPSSPGAGEVSKLEAKVEPGKSWRWAPARKGPGAVTELGLKVSAENLEAALRGTRLRLSFDGSQRPQVDSPVGDFFGSGPGVNPLSSLPLGVSPDGTMECRFVMPFSNSVDLELMNFTPGTVAVGGSVKISPWAWDERSMYFRAKWRADHDLLAGSGVLDLPYAVVLGKGVFAGCAAMILNPSGVPTAGGNWWGEGDEKILVDGELTPSTFGTGSEDYFNYSWSRPDLFDHPYCGQPLCSGPDTSGFISNHRLQILDTIPFERSLAAYLELWPHNLTPGMSYARITYLYARPGAVDDHRGLQPSDLRVPRLPPREAQALGGATGARIYHFEDLKVVHSAGTVERIPVEIAIGGHVVAWHAEKGARLEVTVPVDRDGELAFHLVAIHAPDGAVVRASVAGKPLQLDDGGETVSLRSPHGTRDLNVHFKPVKLEKGEQQFVLECLEPGLVGLDYLWVK